MSQSFIEPSSIAPLPASDQAPVHEIASQVGRGLVESRLDGVDDAEDRVLEGLAYFLLYTLSVRGSPGHQVADGRCFSFRYFPCNAEPARS